ncbi:MAG: hypothetical protein JW793_11915 [Acidobacteria bacterium]|nr:hypothetical protein [Acidobacteriota bacterium]
MGQIGLFYGFVKVDVCSFRYMPGFPEVPQYFNRYACNIGHFLDFIYRGLQKACPVQGGEISCLADEHFHPLFNRLTGSPNVSLYIGTKQSRIGLVTGVDLFGSKHRRIIGAGIDQPQRLIIS